MSQMADTRVNVQSETFLVLHTHKDERLMLVNFSQIDVIVDEIVPIDDYEGLPERRRRTKVVLRSGEQGYCKEYAEEIMEALESRGHTRASFYAPVSKY